jgi:YYY domain-containing protein
VPNIQPDGINEVPFFSILLSDLHPHFMALAFETLVLAAIASHWLSRGRTLLSPWAQAASALALGTLLVANTWDIAPFWLLYLGLTFLAAHQARADLDVSTRKRLVLVVAAPLGGIVLFLPYFIGYQGPPLGLGIVETRTPIGSFLAIFGAHLVLLAAIGVWSRWRAADRFAWGVAIGGVVLGVLLGLIGQPTLGLLVALAALVVPLQAVFARVKEAESLAVCLAAFAVAMLLGVEVIFLRDTFGTRMNTVFKFHYNAWVLSGLAGAVGVALIAASVRGWVRWATLGLVGLSLLAGLVYPIAGVQTRLAQLPPNGPTLDGLAFLAGDERTVIQWLGERARDASQRPVVAEAVSGQYSLGARMATYSGAASVLGWAGHELQWRGPLPELSQREGDLARLYRDADPTQFTAILRRYGVDYVVVGDLEREKYGPGVTTRFDGHLPVAYRSGRVTVYQAP